MTETLWTIVEPFRGDPYLEPFEARITENRLRLSTEHPCRYKRQFDIAELGVTFHRTPKAAWTAFCRKLERELKVLHDKVNDTTRLLALAAHHAEQSGR